jgi:hypothetical protein
MDLFTTNVPPEKLHPLFKKLIDPAYLPERLLIESWADGFYDRDGKFAKEFQTTFESCLWELYLFACLKERGAKVDFDHYAPDFVVETPQSFCMEATIAAPAVGGASPVGYNINDMPDDFNAFNSQAAIRIANSFSSKLKKYREGYAALSHVKDRPFVLAIAAFDRPFAHFASNRPAIAALYGLNYDEDAAIAQGPSATEIPSHHVSGAYKENGASVPLGLFLDDSASEVSAVVYSCLASWGKLRALADSPDSKSIYQTIHPSSLGILPEVRVTEKENYVEHLADGLYVFHNPYAKFPLRRDVFNHDRVAQIFIEDDELISVAPDDFLLLRMISSVIVKEADAA